MNILFLAPHPFYQERGTPIAVDLLLRTLSKRGDTVDVVTFHEGENRTYANIIIHRIPHLSWIKNVPPGFSWRKIICDFFLFIKAVRLAARNKYDLVYAVEEAVFCAMFVRLIFRIPFIFDMDSSMPMQMMEKLPILAVVSPTLKFFEAWAARKALAVVAVCEDLAKIARAGGARQVFVLHDISLLSADYNMASPVANPEQHRLVVEHPCCMYIGNLETYQGIDLLLESFARVTKSMPQAFLAIIGGSATAINKYKRKSVTLGVAERVSFCGPRPPALMAQMFAQADILVSPRIKGANTPMKIYSYLQSGKPILATDLPTHTQALDCYMAMLADPTPDHFAAAMLDLLHNPSMGKQLAAHAMSVAQEKYSLKAYEDTVARIFRQIAADIAGQTAAAKPTVS